MSNDFGDLDNLVEPAHNELTELLNMADIDLVRIKDDLVDAEARYRRLTFDLLRAKLEEIRTHGVLEHLKIEVESIIRGVYDAGGMKKPTEAAIKGEVLLHEHVVAAADAAADAVKRVLVAKAKVDVVAKRESIARTLASLIKAELNSLD